MEWQTRAEVCGRCQGALQRLVGYDGNVVGHTCPRCDDLRACSVCRRAKAAQHEPSGAISYTCRCDMLPYELCCG